MQLKLFAANEKETYEIGEKLAQTLSNSIVAFYGDLGFGKTTLIKGMAQGLNIPPQEVVSPTFTYLNIYDSKTPLYHFDLYRIKDFKEFQEMGFEDYFSVEGVVCIEWAERIQNYLPAHRVDVVLEPKGLGREIQINSAYEKISI
jgi:tRNA threonylcarbamoyladenosine biosynthesis protein TsaE